MPLVIQIWFLKYEAFTWCRYASPTAFRKALEDHLQALSKKEGTDLQRVRRQVAFDRLLARLFSTKPSAWSLKGGYAMELRTRFARATKDIDLNLRLAKKQQADAEGVRDKLVEALTLIFPPPREHSKISIANERFKSSAHFFLLGAFFPFL